MFLSAWKQDGFELIWSRNSYSFLMPGLLLTSWFIFICLLDFFVYEMLDYITATFSFFFKAYEVWLLSTTKMKTEGGGNYRLAESADCFYWEWLFSCLVIPNYKSEFITLNVYSKYQKSHFHHFHDRINPVKVFWNCTGIVLLKDCTILNQLKNT